MPLAASRRALAAAVAAAAVLGAGCTRPPPAAAPPTLASPRPTVLPATSAPAAGGPGSPSPSPDRTVAPPSPAPSAAPASSPPPRASGFPLERVVAHIDALSRRIGPRAGGTPGEEQAAAYLVAMFEDLGFTVTTPEVPRPQGGVSRNVVARFRNVDYSAGYRLIGGHYDSVPGGPGANDNASGVAVILGVAEAMRGRPAPLEFVAFALEERQPPSGEHHIGSEAYVAAMPDQSLLKGMLSVDMVANGPRVLVGRRRGAGADLQEEILRAGRGAGIPVAPIVKGDVSDHVPFSIRGIPAAWLWTGEHPSFHRPSDTMAVVQPEAVGRAGDLILAWLSALR